MTGLRVHIQAHKTRPLNKMYRALEAQGVEPTSHVDMSDHYLAKGHARMRGNWENYHGLLQFAAQRSEPWQVVLQDDVSVPTGLIDRFRYVLSFMPGGVVTFYVPQAQIFADALATGRHVVETYTGQSILAVAFHLDYLSGLLDFVAKHVEPSWRDLGDGCADDDALILYGAVTKQRTRVIVPSFVQHMGLYTSTFGTSWKIGKQKRMSPCYVPDFDVRSVDWEAQVKSPVIDGRKLGHSDKRWTYVVGL